MSLNKPFYLRRLKKYWHQEESGKAPGYFLLGAAAALYEAGARLRREMYRRGWRDARHLPAPVVSVGNLTVGGTGKTPLTAHLARLLQEQGRRVAILSRGYGGRRNSVTCLSDGERLSYRPPEVGDEAFWLAQNLPGVLVYTGPCRYSAGLAAFQEHRPDVFLLDDGFQHFQLARDLELVLLDAKRPFGNGRLLPAGPLREPPSALADADLIILSRYEDARLHSLCRWWQQAFPRQKILTMGIEPLTVRQYPPGEEVLLTDLRGLKAVAFAGLARPEVFRESLTSLGVALLDFYEFPDHYDYPAADLATLEQKARCHGAAVLITTGKDWARLGGKWPGGLPLLVLEVAARVEPQEELLNSLAAALGEPQARRGPPSEAATVFSTDVPHPLPPKVGRGFRKLKRQGLIPPPSHGVRRILVRAPNWVGDAVMSLPVLAGLGRLFPAAALTVLAVPRVAPLFAGQPGVRDIMLYPAGKEKWRVLWGLGGQFDLALALPNSLEAALGLWLSRAPFRLGYAADGRSPFLTMVIKGRSRLKGLHQVFYYLGLLEAFGPVREFTPPRLHLSAAERAEGMRLLDACGNQNSGPWVALAPGASFGPAKRWPAARFAAVADKLRQECKARLVLLGGPDDCQAAMEVEGLSKGGPILNLAGLTTLRQALAVVAQAKVLITNDSGLMHAAAAVGTPVVAIFGSTDPRATGPFTQKATVIYHPRPCSPCLRRLCPADYACLMAVTVDEVAAAASGWLTSGGPGDDRDLPGQ